MLRLLSESIVGKFRFRRDVVVVPLLLDAVGKVEEETGDATFGYEVAFQKL